MFKVPVVGYEVGLAVQTSGTIIGKTVNMFKVPVVGYEVRLAVQTSLLRQ